MILVKVDDYGKEMTFDAPKKAKRVRFSPDCFVTERFDSPSNQLGI